MGKSQSPLEHGSLWVTQRMSGPRLSSASTNEMKDRDYYIHRSCCDSIGSLEAI